MAGPDSSKEEHHDGLEELRRLFAAKGWYRKASRRVLLELAGHVGLTVGGLIVLSTSETFPWSIAGFAIALLGSLGVVTNTHTSSHGATSEAAWLNDLLTYFGYPFFVQVSASYWWHKHCTVHHPAPNVIGIDDDADLSPWFALTDQEIRKSTGLRRSYYSIQYVFLPWALLLNGFNFQIAGWRYLITVLANREQRKTHHWIDLFALLVHWLAWIGLPAMVFALPDVMFFYVARTGLMGILMFCVLAPAHFPVEAFCLDKRCLSSRYPLLQTSATVNFRTGWLGRIYCSGLDYQIEHHLFPRISHVYYPAMSRYVRDYCHKAGYPYRTLGWGEAIWKSYLVFVRPKPVQPSLRDTASSGS